MSGSGRSSGRKTGIVIGVVLCLLGLLSLVIGVWQSLSNDVSAMYGAARTGSDGEPEQGSSVYIYVKYTIGAVMLAAGLVVLGVSLLPPKKTQTGAV